MSFGQLSEIGRNKSNSGNKYKIDGQWYYPDRSCNTDGIQAGMQVEYSSYMGGSDGKLRIVSVLRPAGVPPSQPNEAAKQPAPTAQVSISPLDGEGMRFVSNLLAHAIAAGKVEKPEDLSAWARGAKNALKSLTPAEIDDEVGF